MTGRHHHRDTYMPHRAPHPAQDMRTCHYVWHSVIYEKMKELDMEPENEE